MKNLHICNTDKFIKPYIEFINDNFDIKDHLFYVIGKDTKHIEGMNHFKNVVRIDSKYNSKNNFNFFMDIYKSKKVFIHGLFQWQIVLIFFLQPWLLKKANWIIWGGDLYHYKFRKINWKYNIYELIRKYVIKKLNGVITYIKGDYKLAKKWYKFNGKWYNCIMYPSNLHKEIKTKKQDDNGIYYIQVGNSADPKNNHYEILKRLEKYKENNIRIICPLSYGNELYADKIEKDGMDIFGSKFIGLRDFLPISDYLSLQSDIDIAIFNHERQQAMGNIITLLGWGKKVYIRGDISTWEFFKENQIKVYNTNNDFDDLFNNCTNLKNIDKIKEKFSSENLKCEWEYIFKN